MILMAQLMMPVFIPLLLRMKILRLSTMVEPVIWEWLEMLDAPLITQDNPITINLSFSKVGSGVVVSGLEEADINSSLTGGRVDPRILLLQVMETRHLLFGLFLMLMPRKLNSNYLRVADYLVLNQRLAVKRVIGIVPDVLAKNEITNWWWFNESLGRVASDSVGDNDGTLWVV